MIKSGYISLNEAVGDTYSFWKKQDPKDYDETTVEDTVKAFEVAAKKLGCRPADLSLITEDMDGKAEKLVGLIHGSDKLISIGKDWDFKEMDATADLAEVNGMKVIRFQSWGYAQAFVKSNEVDALIKTLSSRRLNEATSNEVEFINAVQANPTYKKAAAICKKYGYQIARSCYVRSGYIVFNVLEDRKKMQPSIQYDPLFGGSTKFKIATISYGSLNLEEYSQFLDSCNSAYKMCQELSKLDLSQLQSFDEFTAR